MPKKHHLVQTLEEQIKYCQTEQTYRIFCRKTTARCAADLIVVNRKTAAYCYHRLREIIELKQAQEADAFLSGEIEVDESYFGGYRKGKRGRGSAGKVPVFGLLKRGGKVYNKNNTGC